MKGELLAVLRGGPEVGDAWQLGATTQRVGAAFQCGGCADVVERRWLLNEEQSAAARRPV